MLLRAQWNENSSFACIFKHCGLKTSDWNTKNSTACKLSVSEHDFCNWVESRSGHIHTLNEPYQSLFGRGPRPPLQLGLGAVVWSAPDCDFCIHTCPKDPHQEGKQTWVWFNRTKQDRCEYTLRDGVNCVRFVSHLHTAACLYVCLQGKPGAFKDALKCVWRPKEMLENT